MTAKDPGIIRTCGCSALPRRKCDLCLSSQSQHPFVACSLACLREHVRTEHHNAKDSVSRAIDYQSYVNRQTSGNRERYSAHRDRLMQLVGSVGGGADICVMGAGNCTDLDPDRLAREFSTIHLVDLDSEALERGRQSFAPGVRDRVLIHSGVDLSGFLDRLDDWGDRFPDPATLAYEGAAAMRRLRQRMARTFHVVLSDCVLSQLMIPFRYNWLMPAANWNQLHHWIMTVHLATIVGSVAEGGHGVLATDVLDSKAAPELRGISPGDTSALERLTRAYAARGAIVHPESLAKVLTSAALGFVVESPRLTPPWLWNTGDTQLVYGLAFERGGNGANTPPGSG